MRPLELELAGFRSYDRETVDWREHELVVIAGDTGAGKTSLLDAISYALYARTPEGGRPRDLLTLGRENGEVRLTFAMDGHTWRVTRRYGADVPDPAHLLERLGADGAVEDRVAGDATVSARLVELLGMGFEAFTSAVLLAQGRFAQFLSSEPKQRDAILRELFGVSSLEGARPAAVAAREAAARQAETLAGEALRLPPHGPAERVRAARAVRAAAARRGALRALAPLADRARRRAEEAGEAAARAERLADARAALPGPSARAALRERLARADRRCREAQAARDAAARDRALAAAARDDARRRHGGGAADLAGLADAAERVRSARARLPAEEGRLGAALSGLAAREADQRRAADALSGCRERAVALAALAGARAAAEERARREEAARAEGRRAAAEAERARAAAGEAEAGLAAVRDGHMAAHLRAGLAPGDACPVCGAMVLPSAADPAVAPLGGAEAQARRARAAAEAADRAAAGLASALAGASAEREAAVSALAEAAGRAEALGGPGADAADAARLGAEVREREAAVAAEAEALAARRGALAAEAGRLERAHAELARDEARLGPLAAAADPAAEVRAAVAALRGVEEALEPVAARERECAERLRARLEEREALERREVAGLRQAAARLAERLGEPSPPVALPAGELVAACDDLDGRAGAAQAESEARARAAVAEMQALAGAMVRGGGPADPAGLPRQAAAAEDALAEARRARGAVEDAAARAAGLAAREREARAAAARHAQVAADLQAHRFPRYLLQRYRGRLAVGASARLQELTGGAYRFAGREPDPLAVVDVRRGERTRAASTLSGGERFLASLALALGLSDVAAESGGRLDCLFLDEGFSTLDAESLEQAMCGVERLAGDGRLIGVITHLPGVAERLGAAIRVTKDAAGVSRVTGSSA